MPVIEAAITGTLTNSAAATRLQLSTRQVIRLKKGVKEKGAAALAHKNRGRKPAHAVPDDTRQHICRLASGPYAGANAQFLSELLAERHEMVLSGRTVQRILKAGGVPNPRAQKKLRRFRRRKRRPREGELVQMDASPFLWLEHRAGEMSLHGAVDDATGKILGLYFRPTEDLIGYLHVLGQMLIHHGVPQEVYSDRHTIFFSPSRDKLSLEEELEGKTVALTQFGRALDELGIGQIPAYTPQAKGRIERLWGTLQERLVIEMRIAGIRTLEEANAFLPGFIRRYNAQFAVEAGVKESAFLPAPPRRELERIVCIRHERKAGNASTISWRNRTYQLVDGHGKVALLKPRSKVYVLEGLDGRLRCEANGRYYELREFVKPLKAASAVKRPSLPLDRPTRRPAADHPWRRFVINPKPKAEKIPAGPIATVV